MCGKSLAHHLEALDNVAQQLKLRPLSDMISFNPADLEDFLDDVTQSAIEETWFVAADGLATVHALTTFVKANPDQFDQAPQLLEDLTHLTQFLQLAEQNDAGFHFSLDF